MRRERSCRGFDRGTSSISLWKSFTFSSDERSRVEAKKELSAQKATFSQPEIRHESGKVPFNQMKVSQKTHRAKKRFEKE